MGWLALCPCLFFVVHLNLAVNTNLSDGFGGNPLLSVQSCYRRILSELGDWYFLHEIMLLGWVFLTVMLAINAKPVKKIIDGVFFCLGWVFFFFNCISVFSKGLIWSETRSYVRKGLYWPLRKQNSGPSSGKRGWSQSSEQEGKRTGLLAPPLPFANETSLPDT